MILIMISDHVHVQCNGTPSRTNSLSKRAGSWNKLCTFDLWERLFKCNLSCKLQAMPSIPGVTPGQLAWSGLLWLLVPKYPGKSTE